MNHHPSHQTIAVTISNTAYKALEKLAETNKRTKSQIVESALLCAYIERGLYEMVAERKSSPKVNGG